MSAPRRSRRLHTSAEPPARIEVDDAAERQKGLSARQRLATRALAEALFTSDDGPPPAERIDWLVDDLDDLLGRAGLRARLLYTACLFAISVLAPLYLGKLPSLRALSQDDRVRALEHMERGSLGLAVFGAKAVLCILYYEHPDAARGLGFDGACLVEPTRALAPRVGSGEATP